STTSLVAVASSGFCGSGRQSRRCRRNLASSRRALPETFEDGAAARGEAVPDLEALGEPELLELADVALERQLLLTSRRREVAGSHLRAIADQVQNRQRPGAVTAGRVEAGEPPLQLGQLVVSQRVATAQLRARVRPGDM